MEKIKKEREEEANEENCKDSEIKEKCVTATLQNTDGMGLIKNAISQ